MLGSYFDQPEGRRGGVSIYDLPQDVNLNSQVCSCALPPAFKGFAERQWDWMKTYIIRIMRQNSLNEDMVDWVRQTTVEQVLQAIMLTIFGSAALVFALVFGLWAVRPRLVSIAPHRVVGVRQRAGFVRRDSVSSYTMPFRYRAAGQASEVP